MAHAESSMSDYERLLIEFQPAIANRDKMVSQYCGAVKERELVELPTPAKKGGVVMALYRLFGGK